MRRGVFVGVSRYTDPQLQSLKYAATDARLASDNFFKLCGFDPHDSKVLLSETDNSIPDQDGAATLENIHKELARQRELDPCEAFVFYFSGHGFRAGTGIDYLAPQRAATGALERSSISLASLISDCSGIPAERVIIFVDACRQRILGQALFAGSTELFYPSILTSKELSIFLSASPGCMSYESSAIRSGVFTNALCSLLSADFNCKSLGQIYDALLRELPRRSTTVSKPLQIPYGIFVPDLAKKWVLAISKIARPVEVPSWIGEELRQKDLTAPNDQFHGALCIDFGTTKTVAAYVHENEICFVKDERGRLLTPSTVRFDVDGNYLSQLGREPAAENGDDACSRLPSRRLTARATKRS